MTNAILRLGSYDELYIIDLNRVLFMQADDHYTHVHYSADIHFMVPSGLGAIEERIAPKIKSYLIRLGRKYIINTHHIYRISTIKGCVCLFDANGNTVSLPISKPILRSLIELMKTGEVKPHKVSDTL